MSTSRNKILVVQNNFIINMKTKTELRFESNAYILIPAILYFIRIVNRVQCQLNFLKQILCFKIETPYLQNNF